MEMSDRLQVPAALAPLLFEYWPVEVKETVL